MPVKEPGLYHGFVEVAAADDLPFDNRRWLAFQARLPDRVLLIDGEPGPSVFWQRDLLPRDGSAAQAARRRADGIRKSLRADARRPGAAREVPLPDLSPFHVVVLCNVADVSPSRRRALWLASSSAGGNLIIFTGDQVKAGAYAALEQAKLLPARLQGPAEIGSYRFADWSKDHPILSPFTDPQYGDLRTLRFRSITRLVPDPEARVLATTQGGAPLVLERSLGHGRCILSCVSGRQRLGRLGHSSTVCAAGPSIARLPDQPAAGDQSREIRSRRPGPGARAGCQRWKTGTRWSATSTPPSPRSSAPRWPSSASIIGSRGRQDSRTRGSGARERWPPTGERPDELWRTVAWVLLIVLVVEMFVANRTYA